MKALPSCCSLEGLWMCIDIFWLYPSFYFHTVGKQKKIELAKSVNKWNQEMMVLRCSLKMLYSQQGWKVLTAYGTGAANELYDTSFISKIPYL
jgi:hypothetical protein